MSLRCSIYGEHVSPEKNPGSLSHLSLRWVPETFQSGDQVLKLDLFKHSLSTKDGLPPYAQARIIDLISTQLKKYRRDPFLWVSVDSPGRLVPYRANATGPLSHPDRYSTVRSRIHLTPGNFGSEMAIQHPTCFIQQPSTILIFLPLFHTLTTDSARKALCASCVFWRA